MATYYKPVLKLKEKTYGDLLVLAQNIKDATDGNPLFPSLPISAATQQANIDIFSNLILEWGPDRNHGSKLTLALLRSARNVIRQQLRTIGCYVNGVALGDSGIILAAGFPHTNDKTVYGTLPAAGNLRTPFSKNILSGHVYLRWSKVKGAKSYVVYGMLGVVGDVNDLDEAQFLVQAIVPDTRAMMNVFKNADMHETPLVPGSPITYYVKAIGRSVNGRSSEGVRSAPFFARVPW